MKSKILTIGLAACMSFAVPAMSNGQVVPDANTIKITGETSGDYAGESVVAVGDVTGDFYPDFIVSARRWPSGVPTGRVYIVKGKPEGIAPNFKLANADIKIEGGYFESAGNLLQAVGDMDKDRINDFIFATITNQVSVYLVYGSKTLPATFNVANIGTTVRGVKIVITGGLVFDTFDVADVFGSNKADIVFSDNQTGEVYVIDGETIPANGTLTISPAFFNGTSGYKYTVPGANYASTFAIGDFNGDGAKDIAVLNYSIGKAMISVKKNTTNQATIVLNDAYFTNGTNGTKINIYIALNSRRAAAIDFNGDNFDDLVLFGGNQYPNRYDSGVFFGKAVFPAAMDSQYDLDGVKGSLLRGFKDMGGALNNIYTFVKINDINADGKKDIAAADYMNNRILLIPVKATWPALYDVNADTAVKKITSTRTGFARMINYAENLLGGIGCGSDPALLIGTFSGAAVNESYIQKLVQ